MDLKLVSTITIKIFKSQYKEIIGQTNGKVTFKQLIFLQNQIKIRNNHAYICLN